jgi:type IV pilus assembly protein PilC
MAKFSYTAITQDGKNKKGVVEAGTKEAVSSILKESGMFPLTIVEQGALQKELVLGNPVKTKDLTIFCQQFEAILGAGVSVLEALHLLKEQTENKYLAKVIEDMYLRVERGEALSASMQANSKYFPSILINMVEAGEVSGSLEIALDRMATHFLKEHELQQSVKKATTYPAVVSVVALIVVVILVVVVVPTFVSMFDGMGMELPASTKALLAISSFITHQWYILIVLVIGSIVGFSYYAKSELGSITLGRIKLKLPIIGPVQTKIVAARFSRTLSTLLASGLPLLDAIAIVAKVVDNYVVEKGLLRAQEQVSKGIPLSKPIEEMGAFPPMINHMVRIGEETGQLEPILNKVADFYDREVETAVAQLTTMLEPAIIVVLAVVVGFVVISIIQPMFGMYKGVGSM